MNCKRYIALLNEFVDCTLPQDILDDIRDHMESCERCKIFYKTYSLTITLSRKAETTCMITPEQIARLINILFNTLMPDK